MEKQNTKQRILKEALDLFSVRGYEGVSVKEIASAVGIKDSSLYKHFKSKRQIFDTLLEEMHHKFEETVTANNIPSGAAADNAAIYGERNLAWLKEVVRIVFLFFFEDPYASKFRKMVTIEQYGNSRAATTFRNFFIDNALTFQTELFDEMGKLGFLEKRDPKIMAIQFYAPLFLLLMEYDTMPEKVDEAIAILMRHVEQFSELYKTK